MRTISNTENENDLIATNAYNLKSVKPSFWVTLDCYVEMYNLLRKHKLCKLTQNRKWE